MRDLYLLMTRAGSTPQRRPSMRPPIHSNGSSKMCDGPCKQEKPIGDFYMMTKGNGNSYRSGACKVCYSARVVQRRQEKAVRNGR